MYTLTGDASTFYVGICYGFEVMRFAESPDVPFTVIYERFPTGDYE